MKYIFSLFIALWSIAAWGQEGGDGFNPSNPGEPGQRYNLTVNVTPDGAGSTSPSGKQQYALGESVYLSANANNYYQFVGWEQDGDTISRSRSFNYTIPAKNTTVTAVFKATDSFNPDNPDDPSQEVIKYKLMLTPSPIEGGRFNITSGERFSEGTSISVYAYPNSSYQFEGWKQGEILLSTESPYSFVMGKEDVSITGLFRFNPDSPGNPGANHWNAETGELIIDDFTPGSIMNAVDNVIGGSGNRSKVSMVIISGQMASYDFGITKNLSNCTLLDLSRTGGYTEIPSYAFDGTNLSTIILPAGIERIGNYAFRNCKNLTNIICHAITPPTVSNYTFEGIADGAVVHVLASAIPLYTEAPAWKDLTILPLTEDVRTLEVNLPADSEGTYKNMTLELQNLQNGQKQRYVVSDRITYTFNGLLKNCTYNVYLKTPTDVVLGQIEKIEIKEENQSVTFSSLLALLDVNLKVQTPDGTDVTDQAQITWLNDKQAYLSQGSSLKAQTAGTKLNYRIVLNQILGTQYITPENQTYIVKKEENQLVYTLTPIEMLKVSGLVKNANDDALSGAVISISQKLNGKYSKSFIAQTDTKGRFELEVYNNESTISISATNYISQTLTKTDFNAGADLGTIELKMITGTTINLSFTYTPSAVTGEEANTQSGYSDHANISYTIYNVTQNKSITQYSVQYPSIVLLEEVSEGDQLRITASSKNAAFLPIESLTTIDSENRANVTFNIVSLGSIQASYTSTDNVGVSGILYNAKGELLKKYTYTNASLSIPRLPDGKYTLISMGNSNLFNSILALSQLPNSGLEKDIDYILNSVTVKSGEIVQIHNKEIPLLKEDKLYYTDENTTFATNKTSTIAGNYLTLKGKLNFRNEYSNNVSDVQMIIDLPESYSFIDNSVMTGNHIASYTLDGNRLIIPLTEYTDLVRFCVIPTESGTYSPNAFVKFTLEGQSILQPIGSAVTKVKNLSLNIPNTVSQEKVNIFGTAKGKSSITIYDNGVIIGQTQSTANGNWYIPCNLYKAYSYSLHKIHARVLTEDNVELQSEIREVVYDPNAIQPAKVTMINTAHPASNLDLCEYVTVFDFVNPAQESPIYWYWPNYPDFTFKIEFTKSKTQNVESVTLDVITEKQEIIRLKALYDEDKKIWIANNQFHTGNLPINVKVNFSVNGKQLGEDALISIVNSDFTDREYLYKGNIDNIILEKESENKYVVKYKEDEAVDIKLLSFEKKNTEQIINYVYRGKNHQLTYDITPVNELSTEYEECPLYENLSIYSVINETKGKVVYKVAFPSDLIKNLSSYEGDVIKEEKTKTFLNNLLNHIETNRYVLINITDEEDTQTPSTRYSEENYEQTTTNQRTGRRLNRLKKSCNEDLVPNRRLDSIRDRSNRLHRNNNTLDGIRNVLDALGNLFDRMDGELPNAAGAGVQVGEASIHLGQAVGNWSESFDIERDLSYYEGLCNVPPEGDEPSSDASAPDAKYVMDPSGFVYEAVGSNRLQGVTATCYYKEMVEDMYGDLHEEIKLWNAAEYAQENPLFTDRSGMYAWDVPQGLWQVKFEKEGYQTTYSEWLPVPPPQLEVNIGMVQTAQPTVTAVRGYETGIEIDFSKFMLPETMTAEFITITRNGETVIGEVTFKNAEANPQNKNEQFVSKVRFVPSEALATTDKVILTVSKRVKSYAGIQMENDYNQEIPIEKEPKAVVASEIEVVYNETAEITVTVDPAEASTGKKVTATSVSSTIAAIEPAEATLDEEGKATFTISGELPGQTMIQFAVEGMDMKPEVKVSVVEAGEKNITQNYTLAMGWNWFSINVQDQNLNDIPALLAPIKESVLILKGQNGELTNKNESDWEGSLNSLSTTQAYKIKMKKEATLELTGKGSDPTSNTITLNQGWNWIGYVPTVTLPLEQALQNLQAEENDLIKGLDSFAIYDGSTWTGSLTHLLPGEGYMYYSQSVKSFNYAANGTESEPSAPSAQWSYDIHQSEDNMIAIAELYSGEQKAETGKFLVGVFVDGECRGIAVEKDGYLFITAHGEQTDGKLTLRAFDTADQLEYNVKEEIEWSGILTGSLTTPVSLHIGEATGIIPISEGLLVYPSPVRHRLYIRGDIGNIEEVRISDTAGQTLILNKQVIPNEGINVSSLSKGIYFIIIKTDNEVIQQKFMKID